MDRERARSVVSTLDVCNDASNACQECKNKIPALNFNIVQQDMTSASAKALKIWRLGCALQPQPGESRGFMLDSMTVMRDSLYCMYLYVSTVIVQLY